MRLVVSCEHGGNKVPSAYRQLFTPHRLLLDSHRGYDPGSLQLAQAISRDLTRSIHSSTVSRLLVDLNRSLHHPQLFSEITRSLPQERKEAILRAYYYPYRNSIESEIAEILAMGDHVLHISVHTFTPTLQGKTRDAEVALLYDPNRSPEKRFCSSYRKTFLSRLPGIQFRSNYPYRGVADGLTTHFRKQFHSDQYLGIELEVNQKFPLQQVDMWKRILTACTGALEECTKNLAGLAEA